MTTYQEGEAQTAFTDGDAAFERNWPYAYSLNVVKGSKVAGKFAVAPLPHGAGGHSVATVGGWQLAVSKYSKHQDAAIEFVRYMTSKAVEKFDTITNSNVPTIPSLANDPAVRKAAPYLNPATANVPRATRPSTVLGSQVQRGLEGHLPGDQPHPQRGLGIERPAGPPVPAPGTPEVAQQR